MRKDAHHSLETRAKIGAAHRGKKLSLEHRAKIAAGGTGRKLSVETRAKISASKMGNKCSLGSKRILGGCKNPNWKGGITPGHDRARNDPRYVEWRTAVFARDNFTCQTCGKRGGDLEAHHIIARKQCEALVYDVPNGLTVCETPCHDSLHAASMRLAG
ncbi:MAG TPA: NUMOD3 domain-containing DNA-binding protein [Thermoguttaceae bacterium]|nr:NUMOD3 domain-containing DNA-binding protein [Thermoguttaceae bacterium]